MISNEPWLARDPKPASHGPFRIMDLVFLPGATAALCLGHDHLRSTLPSSGMDIPGKPVNVLVI
jgi:hypothetical protein